jgi:capsular polysaccharide export protein
MFPRRSRIQGWFRLYFRRLWLPCLGSELEVAVTSMDLAYDPTLRSILGFEPSFHSRLSPQRASIYIGWGRKWSGHRAVLIAAQEGVAFELIEDGFLRSVGRYDPAISLVIDSQGIYYDCTETSDLEVLTQQALSLSELTQAHSLIWMWRVERLSKYNSERDVSEPLPNRYILLCDQTFGDASISHGCADAQSFTCMLDAALTEFPDHTIILKTHPDVVTRGKKGHFDISALAINDRIQVVSDPIHPSKLVEQADAVYTVTSQMGFEALIWGKPVRCFGMPFYAGWGLTEDELPAPERRKPVTLEQLVHAALVKYPRYIDPVTMQRCEPEVTFRHVGLQRRKRQEFPEQITAVGFSRWKRPFITSFLQGSDVTFVKSLGNLPQADEPQTIAVWGSTELPNAQKTSTILRIEDGFLRSSGLGADLVRPLSLVIDDSGIYYDATRPSRLEHILQSNWLDATARERAHAFRKRLVALDLTKYNLGKASWTRPETSQRILLVVGQVETDASIRLGSPDVQSNIELLQRVRSENPSAYIVYKPHPDVVAGLRKRGHSEDEASKIADEVVSQPVALGSLLPQIDEVHTMTSLLGFEALLRGAKVVCHGLPFYAGWGLTEDRVACARRTRALSIDELVHGALIAYPRYYNFERNCFVEPEQAIDQLAAIAETGPQTRSWWRKALRLGIIAWLKLTGSTR